MDKEETSSTQMKPRIRLIWRLVIAFLVGFAVFGISFSVALRNYRDQYSPQRRKQYGTVYDILRLGKPIKAYQQKYHKLPETLTQLLPWQDEYDIRGDEAGNPYDRWGRALHFWTDGTHYRITSYGQDRRPGGVGFDYDISLDDEAVAKVRQKELYYNSIAYDLLPPAAAPTFQQFHNDSLSRGIIATCSLSGFLVFILAWIIFESFASSPQKSIRTILLQLAATAFGALAIAWFLIQVYLSSH